MFILHKYGSHLLGFSSIVYMLHYLRAFLELSVIVTLTRQLATRDVAIWEHLRSAADL